MFTIEERETLALRPVLIMAHFKWEGREEMMVAGVNEVECRPVTAVVQIDSVNALRYPPLRRERLIGWG